MIIWPILWILAMLSLIVATVVAAMREKKARAKSANKYGAASKPMQLQPDGTDADGSQPADMFGAPEGDFAAFDDPFK